MEPEELARHNIEVAERLSELVSDPAGAPKKAEGRAVSRQEKANHLRELGDTADEARAVAQVIAERARELAGV